MKSRITFIAGILLCLAAAANAQTRLQGKVTDSSGEPLVGVAVFYEGTTEAATSGLDGEYSIVYRKGKTVTFSMIGMKTVNATVGQSAKMDVTMEADSFSLDDAIVIGYGKQAKSDLTGSVSSMKGDEIRKTGSNNAIGALQGHVAGLSITSQDGEPGAGFQINIRGNNSINAGSTPLFVIDGVQMDISAGEIASSGTTGSGTYDPFPSSTPPTSNRWRC